MIDELRAYSERWGRDFSLVQAAGGNTSFKTRDLLTVKASGFRLADALSKEIFIDVPMTHALELVSDGPSFADDQGRRASIETSLHAIMPHPVVAHLHMVNAIALAVRRDAEPVLAERLAGLRWGFVPYLKPGVAVAREVQAMLAKRAVDIIILANHGIVVGGDGFDAVDALIETVRDRLETHPRRTGAADPTLLHSIGRDLDLEPVRFPVAHDMATDPLSLDHAIRGTLYPDHVVFLGRGAVRLDHNTTRFAQSRLYLVPGIGAFVTPGLPIEAHEMAACLAEVTARIPSGAVLQPLTPADEDALIGWEAEIYRQNRATAAA